MKTLASPSFFRTFDLLLSTANPSKEPSHWRFDGVVWQCERHSFTGPSYTVTLEVFTLEQPGRNGWKLLVVKEFWRAGTKGDGLRNLHWSRSLSGRATNAIAWFRRQQAALDRELSPPALRME